MKILTPIALVVVFASALAQVGFRVTPVGIRISRNIHEVDPGKLYRSAQLTEEELRKFVREKGIKTVINLQGSRPGQNWFEDELKVLEGEKVPLFNIEMAVQSIPKRFELLKLLDAYKNAERPILLHCRQGADRTGEAVAIYKMEYMGKTREEALRSLSFRYYYVEAFAPSKKYFVEQYKGMDWAFYEYDHCDPTWNYSDRRECPPSL